MADAAASAEAAIAADPEGVWPTIAMSYRRAHEGKAGRGRRPRAEGGGGRRRRRRHRGARRTRRRRRATWPRPRPSYRQAVAADPDGRRTDRGARHGAARDRARGRGGADAQEGDRLLARRGRGLQGDGAREDRPRPLAGGALRREPRRRDGGERPRGAGAGDRGEGRARAAGRRRRARPTSRCRTSRSCATRTRARPRCGSASAAPRSRGATRTAALAELQKAVELDPKNAEAQYQLGYVQHVDEAERGRRGRAPTRRRSRREPGNAHVPHEPRQRAAGRGADGPRGRGADEGHRPPRATPAGRPGSTSGPRSSRPAASRRRSPPSRSPSPSKPDNAAGRGVPRLVVLRAQGRDRLQGARGQGARRSATRTPQLSTASRRSRRGRRSSSRRPRR